MGQYKDPEGFICGELELYYSSKPFIWPDYGEMLGPFEVSSNAISNDGATYVLTVEVKQYDEEYNSLVGNADETIKLLRSVLESDGQSDLVKMLKSADRAILSFGYEAIRIGSERLFLIDPETMVWFANWGISIDAWLYEEFASSFYREFGCTMDEWANMEMAKREFEADDNDE